MRERDIAFEWVRGHNGDAGNARADALAIRGSSGEYISELTRTAKTT